MISAAYPSINLRSFRLAGAHAYDAEAFGSKRDKHREDYPAAVKANCNLAA